MVNPKSIINVSIITTSKNTITFIGMNKYLKTSLFINIKMVM